MLKRHKHIEKLEHLLEHTQNSKILWEEMQIALKEAFDLQDAIMVDLDEAETTEKDVETLTQIFDEREHVWDLMGQIATRALQVKETRLKKAPDGDNHTCCCGGHKHGGGGCCSGHKHHEHSDCCGGHGDGCCGHHNHEEEHHHCGCDAHAENTPKKRCCKKKGA